MKRGKNRKRPDSKRARNLKSARPRASISKKIVEHTEAVDKVGRENIKRGPKLIGSSQNLTPDRQGIGQMRKIITTIDRLGPLRTFSYGLVIRDKNGKVIRRAPRGNILSLTKGQKKFAKIRATHPKGGKRKVLQTKLAKKRRALRLLREQINEKIRGDIFKQLPMTDEIKERYKEYRIHLKAGDEKQAKQTLDEIKELRGITFEIEIFREI